MAAKDLDMAAEKPLATLAEHKETADETACAPKGLMADAAARGQGTTGYEELSIWQTVKAFKVTSAVCFLAALSAATDGYQIRFA